MSYDFKDKTRKLVACWEFKHNGLSDNNPNYTLNLSDESLRAQEDFSQQYGWLFFICITFTRPEEHPDAPMFFVIPRNEKAKQALRAFRKSDILSLNSLWFSPYEMGCFNFEIRGLETPDTGALCANSRVRARYPLPRIVCGQDACHCGMCTLTQRNNASLKKK